MKRNTEFLRDVSRLAVPVALQSMLQASFSIVDQIMIGQLGSVSIAAVGLAGKFSSVYSVVVSAIGAVAGIMIAQYLGQKNHPEVRRSFFRNLWFALGLAAVFTALCLIFPEPIMGLYTKDAATRQAAASYLTIVAGTFLPLAGATLLSTLYRCMEKASLPLYASLFAALLNTGLNYVLIFGKLGLAPMGAEGAAIATLVSQIANCLVMLLFLRNARGCLTGDGPQARFQWRQYAAMLLPVLACEFLWSVGENVYAGIYGNLGTADCAAMTLINPVQGLVIGALCGLSQAAGVLIGKRLGSGDYDGAYGDAKKLLLYGFLGSAALSLLVVLTSGLYVRLYAVEDSVRALTRQILAVYAVVAPFKVQNMILGSGILRSGGKTKYVMMIDLIGTWGFGVPLGLLAAFVLRLQIPWVYLMISLEECVRFAISLAVFRRRGWMQSLRA